MKRSLHFISSIFFAIGFIAILLGSCKKDDEDIIITGTVVDPQSGSPISGANVYLDGKVLNSGIYNEDYSEIASATTDGSGHFEIKTAWQVVSSYRIRAFKNNYFDEQIDVPAESISKGDTYTASLSLLPAAWVRLNINNMVGYAEDQIQYKYSGTPQSCADCCNNSFLTGTGNYHAVYKCRAVGNKYNKFYWTVLRNDIMNPFTDSVYCVAFDTATININY
jgi:hypothetical protein